MVRGPGRSRKEKATLGGHRAGPGVRGWWGGLSHGSGGAPTPQEGEGGAGGGSSLWDTKRTSPTYSSALDEGTPGTPSREGVGGNRERRVGGVFPPGSLCLVPEGPAPPAALWPHVPGVPMPLGSPLPPGESCVPGGSPSPLIHPPGLGGRGGCASPLQPGQNLINTGGGLQFRGLAWTGTRLRGAGGCPPQGGLGVGGP